MHSDFIKLKRENHPTKRVKQQIVILSKQKLKIIPEAPIRVASHNNHHFCLRLAKGQIIRQ
jgi:hypothetical protein